MSNPINDFLADEDLEKRAAGWGSFGREMAVSVAAPVALLGMTEAYRAIKNHIGRERGFKGMLAYNPELTREPAERVRTLFNTLHNASPTLAQDPVVASSWVKRTMYQDEYIDPRTMADIAGAEDKMRRPTILEQLPIPQITSGLMRSAGDSGGD